MTVGKVLSPYLAIRCLHQAGRKDPAVHVSLSSDAIVKQRWTARTAPKTHGAGPKAEHQGRRRHARQTLPGHELQSELGKASKPAGRSISSAAVDERLIGPPSRARQPGFSQKRQKAKPGPDSPPGPLPRAAAPEGIAGLSPAPPPSPHPPRRAPPSAAREKGRAAREKDSARPPIAGFGGGGVDAALAP